MSLPINQIVCGDCLEVMKTFPSESIDLILTDPPYNVGQDFPNDNLSQRDSLDFQKDWIGQCHRILKQTGCFFMTYYVFGLAEIIPILKSFDWKWANLIIWKYPNMISGGWDRSRYEFNYQPILFFKKKNFRRDIQGMNWKGKGTKQDVWIFTACQSNFKKDGLKKIHPTQKPLELFKKIIKDVTDEDSIVLDPFLGSGTTAIAAQKLARKWIGIDISPEYCEVARKRIAQLPEKLASFAVNLL